MVAMSFVGCMLVRKRQRKPKSLSQPPRLSLFPTNTSNNHTQTETVKMAVKAHRRFDGDGDGTDAAAPVAAIQAQAQAQDGADSDDDDDDDAPPEAIETSAAKEAEQSKQREKRIQAETCVHFKSGAILPLQRLI